MTKDRDVAALFADALEQTADERREFVARTCAGDRDAMREVLALLDAHEQAGRFLEPTSEPAEAAGPRSDPNISRAIGPYVIRSHLGSGGMSRVYMAERADGAFEQRVAIKLLDRPSDDATLRRFTTECQALARLEHPNIARMIDGGVDTDGHPYLILELIDGVPLDLDHRARTGNVRERLQIFTDVCDAVHYAHQHFVIHRDLKPSNIMVDRDGRVKLLDFGIARLIDPDGTAPSENTRTKGRIMTPSYASPEQIRGEPLTTATDVYSLGVVLYRLLTGHLPFDVTDSSPAEFEDMVAHTPPTKPSLAVLQKDEGGVVGEDRSRYARTLSGDVDDIVLMALRKEPERRYHSVAAFAEDIRRHLSGHPVTARPDTAGYRIGKFINRHATAVTATTAMVLLLIAATFTSFALYRQADRARADAQQARDVAEQNATTAQQVTDFLVRLFEVSDPSEARGNTITAREVLDVGVQRLEQDLADQPLVQARLFSTLGKVHHNLGLFDQAETLLRRAIQLRRDTLRTDHPDIALAMRELANLFNDAGHYDSAAATYQRVLDVQEAAPEVHTSEIAITLAGLGSALEQANAPERARTVLERAVEIFQTGYDTLPQYPIALSNLAITYQALGNLRDAEPVLEQVLNTIEATREPNHPDIATALNNLGAVNYRLGQYGRSQRFFERSLVIMEQVLGPEHPNVGTLANNIALVAKNAGDLDRSLSLYRRALAIDRSTFGDQHQVIAGTLTNVGSLFRDLGQRDSATIYLEQAVTMYAATVGTSNPQYATALQHLGGALTDTGDLSAARTALERSLFVREQQLGTEHISVAFTLTPLAHIDRLDGAYTRAEQRLTRALELITGELSPGHAARISTLMERAMVRAQTGDTIRSDEDFRQALTEYSDRGTLSSKMYFERARYRSLRGELDAAVALLDSALAAGLRPDLLSSNTDLRALQDRPDFQRLIIQ